MSICGEASFTQQEIDDWEGDRSEMLKSKGVPMKGKKLDDDYLITWEMIIDKSKDFSPITYRYSWIMKIEYDRMAGLH